MENEIKYKEAGNGHYIKIHLDEAGKELTRSSSFNQGKPKTTAAGYWLEMQAWIDAGGVVEPEFTAEELSKKEAEAKEAEKTAYIGLRVSEYPSAGDQFDYIYHNGLAAWKNDIITPIKEKYPKP